MNIWYGTGDNRVFSNLTLRPFDFTDSTNEAKERHYCSVEHAYQSLKSGSFDAVTYNKPWGCGSKFIGRKTKTENGYNIDLMYNLIRESFLQNRWDMDALISTGNAKLTHLEDKSIWREKFPELLMKIRKEFRPIMNDAYRVIIAGSRDFCDFNHLQRVCDYFLQHINEKYDIEIVSGTARGADKLGEQYALSSGYKLTRFPADWDTHGKSAGYKRNTQMAEYADALISFQLNDSRGTAHMIKEAKRLRLLHGNGMGKKFRSPA